MNSGDKSAEVLLVQNSIRHSTEKSCLSTAEAIFTTRYVSSNFDKRESRDGSKSVSHQ